ncbi:putative enoyl-CoA hydratase echA8 [compost metagenome]
MSTAQNLQSPVLINDAVRLERDAMVGWVVLTRPGQINAINDEIRQGVPQALAMLHKDPDIRVIVIRGEGERGFCAGADIKERRGPSAHGKRSLDRNPGRHHQTSDRRHSWLLHGRWAGIGAGV